MDFFSKNTAEIIKNLRFLNRAKASSSTIEEYKNKRFKNCLLVLVIFFILSLSLFLMGVMENGRGNTFKRRSFDEGDYRAEVSVGSSYGEKEISLYISPRDYEYEELLEIYPKFLESLKREIPGENNSLNEVSENLNLSDRLDGYPFNIEWISGDITALTNEGEVFRGSLEKKVNLEALISCNDFFRKVSFDVRITGFSKEEDFFMGLEENLREIDESTKTENTFTLPDSYEDQSLKWHVKRDRTWIMVLISGVPITCLVFFMSDRDLYEKVKKVKHLYKCEYPNVVRKLGLYTGAGLTLRASFKRLWGDYSPYVHEEGSKKALVASLLKESINRFDMGESEAKVYEDFGKATGLPEYIRFSGILVQNLKKGSRSFSERIREESMKAEASKLENGRKLGEEASAKLLLPMVMILLNIMVLMMIPAFFGMGL